MYSIKLFAILLTSALLADAATAANLPVPNAANPNSNGAIVQFSVPDLDDAVDDVVDDADDAVDDAVDDVIDDAVDDVIDDAVDDAVDDVVDDVVDDAVDDVIDDAVDDAVDDVVDDVIDDAVDDVIDDAVDDAVDDVIDDAVDDVIDDAVDDAVDDITGENQLDCEVSTEASTSITFPPFEQQGTLDNDDPKLEDNSLYEILTFGGCANQTVTINLKSQEFDPYLALFGPGSDSEEPIGENDDINENDQNARLTITLPENGIYSIVVNSYDPEGNGEYTVTIR